MSTLEIPHVGTFEVDVWSAGAGRPLLYLHGYAGHPGGAPFLERLAAHRRVLAPEHPGYGSSTGQEHLDGILDVVLFYRQLVRSFGVERVDVVGHSSGGMVAAELAAVAPQVVRRLVLVDPFGLWLDDEPALDPFGSAAAVTKASWHGEPPASPPSSFVPDPDDPFAGVIFQARNMAAATRLLWPIPDHGLRRRLPLVEAPTLVVRGGSDGLVTAAYAEEFARLVPGAELVTIEGAGHYPMVEQEDEFVAVVERFLDAGQEDAA